MPNNRNVYFNLNIYYCLNNDKRSRHKFFNLALSSPYTYNIQYDRCYYYIISLKLNMKTWNNKCNNKEECDNGILLKVTNQTDPSINIWDTQMQFGWYYQCSHKHNSFYGDPFERLVSSTCSSTGRLSELCPNSFTIWLSMRIVIIYDMSITSIKQTILEVMLDNFGEFEGALVKQ